MSEKRKYYITTPIYYPSAKLHIGHTRTARRLPTRWLGSTACAAMTSFS